MKELERSLLKTAATFGEANETGIARWGVAVCRRLVTVTQAWGDGKDAKKKQENAMMKDANRAVFAVSKPNVVRMLQTGKMSGLIINGEFVKFDRHQLLRDAQAINDWIDLHRTDRKGRVPRLKPSLKGVCAESHLKAAMRIRYKRAGKAKGGWVGAGQEIARFQKKGSRITIGKNHASYSHKWKGGGRAVMRKDVWSPEGELINAYKHASNEHVLKKSDMDKAIADAARNTITWYEKALNGRLK